MKAHIRQDDIGRGIVVHVAKPNSQGGQDIVEQIDQNGFTMRRIEDHEVGPPPLLRGELAESFVQAVLDAAWAHGMRPTGIAGEQGEIRRLEQHLTDMRHVAFKTLKIGNP